MIQRAQFDHLCSTSSSALPLTRLGMKRLPHMPRAISSRRWKRLLPPVPRFSRRTVLHAARHRRSCLVGGRADAVDGQAAVDWWYGVVTQAHLPLRYLQYVYSSASVWLITYQTSGCVDGRESASCLPEGSLCTPVRWWRAWGCENDECAACVHGCRDNTRVTVAVGYRSISCLPRFRAYKRASRDGRRRSRTRRPAWPPRTWC